MDYRNGRWRLATSGRISFGSFVQRLCADIAPRIIDTSIETLSGTSEHNRRVLFEVILVI